MLNFNLFVQVAKLFVESLDYEKDVKALSLFDYRKPALEKRKAEATLV